MSRLEIPPIFHQTWRDHQLPTRWQIFREGWQLALPGWQILLWTDADNRDLVASHYPDLLATYDRYASPIMRSDLARYCFLHRFGGIYADLDCEILRPFPELFARESLVLGLEPALHLGPMQRRRGLSRVLSNAVMISRPGHPFWEEIFEAILAAAQEKEALDATGPFLLTRVFEASRHQDEIRLLGERHFCPLTKFDCWEPESLRQAELPPEAVVIHHWDGSWWRRQQDLEQTFAQTLPLRCGAHCNHEGPELSQLGETP